MKRERLISWRPPRWTAAAASLSGSPTDSSRNSRDGEVPFQKELSSYFEELFSSKVPHQKELSSSNEELFPNPEEQWQGDYDYNYLDNMHDMPARETTGRQVLLASKF